VDAAVARLEAARASDPKGAAELDLALARLHARHGSLVRAERLAERLAASPGASPEAVALLARLRVARRARLPETSAQVARALAASPDDPELLSAQGRLFLALGRDEDGRSLLARAAWLDPSDATTLEHLADARARAGQAARAAQDYARVDAELAVLEALGEPGAVARRARLSAKRRP
jgi:predicted Zn-dependent protease